jgi:hypothetical protein
VTLTWTRKQKKWTATGASGTEYAAWQGLMGWWSWSDGNCVRAGIQSLAEVDRQVAAEEERKR